MKDIAPRTLIVPHPGFSEEQQAADCAQVGRGVVYDDVEDWIRGMRAGETVVVAHLHLIAPAPGTAKRPLAAFNALLDTIVSTRAVLVEGATGARSDDRKSWPAAVARARAIIRSGRHMTRREARRRGAKSLGAIKAQSAAARWAAIPALRKAVLSMWKSSEYANDAAAVAGINAHLVAIGHAGMVFGSPETARRVLGKRT